MDDERVPLRRRDDPADSRHPAHVLPRHVHGRRSGSAAESEDVLDLDGEPPTRPVPTTDHASSGRHAKAPFRAPSRLPDDQPAGVGANGWATDEPSHHRADRTADGGRRRRGAGANGAGQNGGGSNGSGLHGGGSSGVSQNGAGSYGVAQNGAGSYGAGPDDAGSYEVGLHGAGSNGRAQNGARSYKMGPHDAGSYEVGQISAGSNGVAHHGAGSYGGGQHSAGSNGMVQNGARSYEAGLNGASNGSGPDGVGLHATTRNGSAPAGPATDGVTTNSAAMNGAAPASAATNGAAVNGARPRNGHSARSGRRGATPRPSATGGSGSHRLDPGGEDRPTGLIVGRGGSGSGEDPTSVIAAHGGLPAAERTPRPDTARHDTAGPDTARPDPSAGAESTTALIDPGRGRSGLRAGGSGLLVDDVPPAGRRPATRVRPPAADEPPADTPPPRRPGGRRAARTVPKRSLGRALAATLASTVVPGTGLLMVRRKRSGALVLGVFLLVIVALLIGGLTARRSDLVENLLSSRVLLIVIIATLIAGLAWIAQIVRTYVVGRPRGLPVGHQILGIGLVTALCLAAAAPFGYAAHLANSQRSLLDTVFAGNGGGTSVVEAIAKPRLNILLVGSDAGPDRTGARTDTMMVASIDTHTARTTIFGLPRNVGYARFPPGSALAKKFPDGFHDPDGNPVSGNYLLNAVYAYALGHPELAPAGPTKDPGLNALHETVAYMLGIDLDYYVEVNMAGFASIIDALGGVTVDVGPVPLPIDGVLPDGTHVKPSGYVPAGVQHLDGIQALWFARSRRDSDDYNRMGRQRCLLQSVLVQKSPTDVITHFQAIADATTNSVATNVPQEILGQLVSLVGSHTPSLQSVAFDPNLPDPTTGEKFDPNRPDVAYMRQVVQEALNPSVTTTAPTAAATPTTQKSADTDGTQTPADSATPESLASSCG